MKNIVAALLCAALLYGACFEKEVYSEKAAGLPEISAKAYVAEELLTGRILSAKNEEMRLPQASTTKIMTALIALEQPNLDLYFAVDSNAIKTEGTSMGLQEGDSVTLRTLAAGMLLSSGNDAANAAAVRISGSIDEFCEKMNERAREIGLLNTRFENPSGLPNENHYSTAADMAALARAALKNEHFAAICASQKMRVEYGNPPYARWLTNHNRMLTDYEGCIGVKTGFTKKAGRCLVSAAERDGKKIVCVTLNAPNDWQDHKNLLDFGFENVTLNKIEIDCSALSAATVGGFRNATAVEPLGETFAPIQKGTPLETEIYMNRFYYAPVKKGDYIGEIRHLYNGNTIAVTVLVASEDNEYSPKAEKHWFWQKK